MEYTNEIYITTWVNEIIQLRWKYYPITKQTTAETKLCNTVQAERSRFTCRLIYQYIYGASINAISLDVIAFKATNCCIISEFILNAIRLDMNSLDVIS